ncbi:MAG TPA: GNAT family N-acetyltransferase [Candidatus Sulfotelmatobacter sp.]|nr:GNAT family N-acetyltransferase [Candidatus Sulfotelmatobacter sp.]
MSVELKAMACVPVSIREFEPGDELAFLKLNEEWIARYFRIEPKEAVLLGDPKGTILAEGGKIFLAVAENRCVGCCALRRMSDDEFEVAKMAVTPAFQGAGIGRKLLRAVIDAGWALGARRLYLETNHILTPAIRMYESMGFRHLAPEEITPSRYERADVYMELLLR